MTPSLSDIECVVREVIAQIVASREKSAMPTASAAVERPAPVVAEEPGSPSPAEQSRDVGTRDNGDLTVGARVVTMAEVSGRLDGLRRLVVVREAVVTPAVRDELIRRGIALARADSSDGRAAPAIRLAMIASGADFDPTALSAALTREGLTIEQSALDCLVASTEQLAAEVAKPDTLGLLLTRHTAAGLCLANRLGGVRAVGGTEAPAVAVAAAAVGANVLVADPLAGTFFQLKQMVTEFCRGGVRPCPAVFRAQLA